mmetsp:Transcript_3476/g.8202  ORF Transcript_3476/g.8202 Transcript_3476/m.8202 type:complete len:104 (-) Transcript_3476:166-477(-)
MVLSATKTDRPLRSDRGIQNCGSGNLAGLASTGTWSLRLDAAEKASIRLLRTPPFPERRRQPLDPVEESSMTPAWGGNGSLPVRRSSILHPLRFFGGGGAEQK